MKNEEISVGSLFLIGLIIFVFLFLLVFGIAMICDSIQEGEIQPQSSGVTKKPLKGDLIVAIGEYDNWVWHPSTGKYETPDQRRIREAGRG